MEYTSTLGWLHAPMTNLGMKVKFLNALGRYISVLRPLIGQKDGTADIFFACLQQLENTEEYFSENSQSWPS